MHTNEWLGEVNAALNGATSVVASYLGSDVVRVIARRTFASMPRGTSATASSNATTAIGKRR